MNQHHPSLRTWLIVTAAVLGIGTVVACSTGGTDLQDPAPPGQREAPAEPAVDRPDPPAKPEFAKPKLKDFELTTKILSKRCFGSAGCNIDFRVELAYGGPDLDPGKTYEVTYEVTGGEDPYINTLTVSGDQYETQETESISTASDRKLVVEVTDVSEF